MDTDKPARVVMVTRPAGYAGALCSALGELGYRVFHRPLLELEALPQHGPQQRQYLLDLDNYRHVIFVSASAVRYGMERIEALWPQLPVGINWYTVGTASAALLREYGVDALSPERIMTSEGLLALEALQSVGGRRVLLVRGEGGRTLLREELTRRGAQVDELPCYRRKCPALAPGELAGKLEDLKVQSILISSGESLLNLQALLSPQETTKFIDMRLVVPSQRVAEMARDAGFSRVVTAENASDQAMLRALEQRTSSPGDQ